MASHIRAYLGTFLLMCIIATLAPKANGLSCIQCDKSRCKDPTGCNYGLTLDICYCCNRCAKGPGEECGGNWGELGGCPQGFRCQQKRVTQAGKCVPEAQWVPAADWI